MNGVKMILLIKEIVSNTLNAKKLAEVVNGTVKSTSPLEVFVDQQLTLNESCLVLLKHLKSYTAYTDDEEKKPIVIDNALKEGDHVMLIRKQGGQKYYIVGVI